VIAVYSAYHVGPEAAFFWVWIVCTVPLAWLLVFAVGRMRANARLARDAEANVPASVLRAGAAVIAGKVVRGKGKAVRVEIDQTGTETRTKNGYSHQWRETARRVTTDPFELELQSGERVAVVPDQRTFLVDKLDAGRRFGGPRTRTRVAELSEGEAVFVVGVLEPGDPDPKASAGNYREAPVRKLVMRAPKGGRMLIASEPLGKRYRARVWFHTRWCFFMILVAALLHGGVFLGYHLRVWRGQTAGATVTDLHTYTRRSGKSSTTYHDVYFKRDDRWEVEHIDATSSSFRKLVKGERIHIMFVENWPDLTVLGDQATVSWARPLWMSLVLLIFAGWYFGARDASRPWYDKDKIVDSGGGKLPELPQAERD
jgi:hypothetical protein